MSALADVQRALNTIRDITNKEQAAVRLEVVRLMGSAIADEARDIEQSTAPKQKQRRAVRMPLPKSSNVPKLQQVAPKQSSQQQQPQRNTQPIQPIKPIAPK